MPESSKQNNLVLVIILSFVFIVAAFILGIVIGSNAVQTKNITNTQTKDVNSTPENQETKEIEKSADSEAEYDDANYPY